MGTILVVEDDESIREIVSEVLVDEGFAVAGAANGREALDLLTRGLFPSVMLLDLMMPTMNGWQLLAAMREDPRLARIPVVVMTAARTRGATMPSDVVAVVEKPIVLDRLLKILRQVATTAA